MDGNSFTAAMEQTRSQPMLIELDGAGAWVDPREVIGVSRNGSTVVALRGGAQVFPSCSVAEVLAVLFQFPELLARRVEAAERGGV